MAPKKRRNKTTRRRRALPDETRGRKALPDEIARRIVLKVLLTRDEALMLEVLCGRHGINRSAVVRRALRLLDRNADLLSEAPASTR